MKRHVRSIFCLAVALCLVCLLSIDESRANQGRNILSGTVFGEEHRPVSDIHVELLDDFNATLRRTKTDGSGRFVFTGLVDGRFRIKVLPYGTDYMEQLQEVVLTSVSSAAGSGSDRQNVDIYLRINTRLNRSPFASGTTGVVFAQDVPREAQRLYEEGLRYLREKKEKEGFESLRKAIEIFPNYYLALDRLGGEYATRGHADRSYLHAGFVLLMKAVEVNPRGFSSLFGLGWTQLRLGMADQAIETLKRATTVYSKSADAYLWLGKALRRKGALDQAEVAFKRANELTNGKVAIVHWDLAGIYRDQKRYKEAADALELFLKNEPKAADAEKIKALIKELREKASTVSTS